MSDDEINPYQAPADARIQLRPRMLGPNEQTVKFVRHFRQQIHILSGLWLVVGLFESLPLMSFLSDREFGIRDLSLLQMVGVAVAGLWAAIAALTAAKQLWAVALGVGLCTLTAVLAVAAAVFWGGAYWGLLVWLAIFISAGPAQGIKVLRLASELRRAGIPLTLKPHQVLEFFAPPTVVSDDDRRQV